MVYRGQNVVHRSSLADAQKAMGSHGAGVGRWFSSDPNLAMKFAGKGTWGWRPRHWKTILEGGPSSFGYQKGVVKKLKLSMKDAEKARKLASYPSKILLFSSSEEIAAPATGVINRTTVVKDDPNNLFAEASLGTANSSMCRQRNRHAGTTFPIYWRSVPDQSEFRGGHCSVAPVGAPMAKSSSCIPSTEPAQSTSLGSSF